MAQVPAPEESGRRILAIYKANNIRPGEMMLVPALHSPFFDQGGRADDFNAGIPWLLEQGLIEEKPGKSLMYFLTAGGFKEM